jgi:hypothetical protein
MEVVSIGIPKGVAAGFDSETTVAFNSVVQHQIASVFEQDLCACVTCVCEPVQSIGHFGPDGKEDFIITAKDAAELEIMENILVSQHGSLITNIQNEAMLIPGMTNFFPDPEAMIITEHHMALQSVYETNPILLHQHMLCTEAVHSELTCSLVPGMKECTGGDILACMSMAEMGDNQFFDACFSAVPSMFKSETSVFPMTNAMAAAAHVKRPHNMSALQSSSSSSSNTSQVPDAFSLDSMMLMPMKKDPQTIGDLCEPVLESFFMATGGGLEEDFSPKLDQQAKFMAMSGMMPMDEMMAKPMVR